MGKKEESVIFVDNNTVIVNGETFKLNDTVVIKDPKISNEKNTSYEIKFFKTCSLLPIYRHRGAISKSLLDIKKAKTQ